MTTNFKETNIPNLPFTVSKLKAFRHTAEFRGHRLVVNGVTH